MVLLHTFSNAWLENLLNKKVSCWACLLFRLILNLKFVKMARFPEFADWLSKFRAWSADFDRNQSEAQRCLLSGDLGQLSTILQKKV